MLRTLSLRSFSLVILTLGLLLAAPAMAQSVPGMDVLTPEEQKNYTQRLQRASSSADRARVLAELNRLIHTRKLEQRAQQRVQGEQSPSSQDQNGD